MGKKTNTNKQTQTTALDPQSQAYVDQQRKAASDAYGKYINDFSGGYTGNAGAGEIGDATRGFGDYAAGGSLGLRALSGDTDALNQLMGTLDPYFNHATAGAINAANQSQTLQGGGFGSRSGLAAGQAIGTIKNQQIMQALQNASGLANLGFGANQALTGIGQFNKNFDFNNYLTRMGIPAQALGLLNMGLGPTGQTQTQTQTTKSSPFLQALGLGLQFIPGVGQAAGLASRFLPTGGGSAPGIGFNPGDTTGLLPASGPAFPTLRIQPRNF